MTRRAAGGEAFQLTSMLLQLAQGLFQALVQCAFQFGRPFEIGVELGFLHPVARGIGSVGEEDILDILAKAFQTI